VGAFAPKLDGGQAPRGGVEAQRASVLIAVRTLRERLSWLTTPTRSRGSLGRFASTDQKCPLLVSQHDVAHPFVEIETHAA
jgi:hypothetical protein